MEPMAPAPRIAKSNFCMRAAFPVWRTTAAVLEDFTLPPAGSFALGSARRPDHEALVVNEPHFLEPRHRLFSGTRGRRPVQVGCRLDVQRFEHAFRDIDHVGET